MFIITCQSTKKPQQKQRKQLGKAVFEGKRNTGVYLGSHHLGVSQYRCSYWSSGTGIIVLGFTKSREMPQYSKSHVT